MTFSRSEERCAERVRESEREREIASEIINSCEHRENHEVHEDKRMCG